MNRTLREDEFVEEHSEGSMRLIADGDGSFDNGGIQDGFRRLILPLRKLLERYGIQ